MKTLSSCLCGLLALALSTGLSQAQADLEARLSADIKATPAHFGEVPKDDKRIVISKVAQALGQHVTFRDYGVAASVFESPNGRHFVEWKNLRINILVPMQLASTDAGQNITKRVQAQLIFDSCRILNTKDNTWTSWGPRGHPLFPAAINIYWKNGHPMADGGMHLKKFKKGPAATPASATTKVFTPASEANNKDTPGITPAGGGFSSGTGNGGLPPGMKRK